MFTQRRFLVLLSGRRWHDRRRPIKRRSKREREREAETDTVWKDTARQGATESDKARPRKTEQKTRNGERK